MLRSGNEYISNKRPINSSSSSDTPTPTTSSPKPKPKRGRKGKKLKMTITENSVTDNSINNASKQNSDQMTNIFNQSTNSNINDVMQGISAILSKLDVIQSDLDKSNKKIDKNINDIVHLQDKTFKHDIDILNLKGNLNKLQQIQLENDVMLSGFTRQLEVTDLSEIVNNLCGIYNINRNRVHKFYLITTKQKSPTMIVNFWDHEDKMDLISKIISNGPPTQNQLLINSNATTDDIVRCYGRLTKENVGINRKLRQLKREKKIFAVKYRNSCFNYQEKSDSPLIPVSCIDQITADNIEREIVQQNTNTTPTLSLTSAFIQPATKLTQHAIKETQCATEETPHTIHATIPVSDTTLEQV